MAQTNNFIQKYVSVGGPLADSLLFDDGSSLGLGTSSPGGLFQVQTSGADASYVLIQPSGFTPLEGASWAGSMVRIGRDLAEADSVQCILNVQADIGNTSSSTSYEKPALFAAIRTGDVSDTGNNKNLDAVAAHLSGNVAAGNTQGRAWGANCVAVLESGNENTDGLLTGIEVDIFNNAVEDEPDLNTPYNKTGILIVTYGTQNSTNALVISASENSQWHRGIVAFSNSFTSSSDHFIDLIDGGGNSIFVVRANGELVPKTFMPRFVNASSPPSTTPGEFMVWGNTMSGTTYLVFDNGAAQLKVALT